MVLRVVIVGPGRVGVAFATRLMQNGVDVLGCIGRDAARTAAAVAGLGVCRVLDWSALARAHVVVFAVGDAELQACVHAAADSGHGRRCSLWLHTSGSHDLSVFDAAAAVGCRRGALHPVLPFPTAEAGAAAMPGAPAVLLGDERSLRLLRRVAMRLDLEPIEASSDASGGNRVLYHAACALAANGLTALVAEVERVFAAAGGLAAADRQRVAAALLHAALRECAARGPVAALSGPVRRGDAATVRRHRQQLARECPEVTPTYVVLMRAALRLARAAGLPDQTADAVERALE